MKTPTNSSVPSSDQPQTPRISLETAQARISKWLTEAQSMPIFKGNTGAIPRGICIEHADLDDLRAAFPDASGIRLYFGLEEDKDGNMRLTGSIVPVVEAEGIYTDVVLSDGDKSSIFDFTSPCPNFCGLASDMHVPV